jgi:valyl-tRNA synthetase
LAKPALEVVTNDKIKLYPSKFKNTYKHWMENLYDWNISRQLWWGQQIPAYFYGTGMEDFVVAESNEEALQLAKAKTNNQDLTLHDLSQDADVLDTWFSSWLWPISVFDGVRNPENEEINYYYPTQDLVTGPDILFFWVARMVMAGVELRNEIPFENVYLTGIVRDKQRRKMSKSLGNSPEPLDLIKEYGADGVRVGLLLSSSAGNDLLFDEALCLQGRNFANKIWNVFRLIKGWTPQEIEQPKASQQAAEWFDNQFNSALNHINDDFKKFRISDALLTTYKLVWDDFASWYLEIIKPPFGEPIDKKTYDSSVLFLENLMRLLHPFMPFLTEEIWQTLNERKIDDALVISNFPTENTFSTEILNQFKETQELVTAIRNNRSSKSISPKEQLTLIVPNREEYNIQNEIITKLGNVELIFDIGKPENSVVFLVNKTEFALVLNQEQNLEEETQKLQAELDYLEGFLKSVQNKLSNEKFVNNAPPNVLENERKKEADALEKIKLLKKRFS